MTREEAKKIAEKMTEETGVYHSHVRDSGDWYVECEWHVECCEAWGVPVEIMAYE